MGLDKQSSDQRQTKPGNTAKERVAEKSTTDQPPAHNITTHLQMSILQIHQEPELTLLEGYVS